jgi:hypothetical protein
MKQNSLIKQFLYFLAINFIFFSCQKKELAISSSHEVRQNYDGLKN